MTEYGIMTQQQSTGEYGETLASQYLIQHGYTILSRNWHCQFGEIDIVAENNETVVFVEVRTRRAQSTESAFASITVAKREKLIKSATLYLHEHNRDNSSWRIDMIAIALPSGKQAIIDHVEDALDW